MWRRTGLAITVASAVVATIAATPRPNQVDTLARGIPYERALAAGQTHRFTIRLDAGQFLHVVITPSGIDLAAVLIAPDGRELLTVDLVDDGVTPEPLLAIAETSGTFELRVKSVRPRVPAGRCSIRVEALHAATEVETTRVAAMRDLEAGVRLRVTGETRAYQQAEAPLARARDAFRRAGDRENETRALVELAANAANLGRAEAAALAREALTLARERGDRSATVRALVAGAIVHERAGEMDAVRDSLTEALTIVKATNPTLEAVVRNRLGVLYGRTSDPERAIHEFTEALRVARLLQLFRLEAGTLNNLGIATKDLGEFRSSLAYYEQSLQVTRTQGRRAEQTNALNNIGNLQRLLGEHEKALDSHRQALAIARETGDVDNEGRALNTIGLTLYRLGEFRQALDYHEQALDMRRRIADRAGEASALDGIGLASHRLGQSDKALEALNDSLRIRRSIAARLSEPDTLRHLALVERDRGNLSAALDHVVAAVAVTDSLRDRVVSPDLRASFVAGEQEQYELQIDILMQLHLQTRHPRFLVQALEASERGRARVLLESLRESRADVRQGIDPALLEQQRGVQRQLDRASTRLSQVLSRDSPPADVDAARRTVETLSETYTKLQIRIRQESPAYAALTQAEASTAPEIQRDLLDADTLLLEYALGDERSWLWMVASNTVASFELPPRREIESAARRFYQLLTARQPNPRETHSARVTRIARADRDLRGEAVGLGRTLLGPVASRLAAAWRGKRLLVVAPAVLQHIPFSSLIDPANGTDPLVIDHEIVSLPSASVLAEIRRRSEGRRQPAKQLAVLADPVFEVDDPRVGRSRQAVDANAGASSTRAVLGRLSRLPFSREEAHTISALVPRGERLEATDFQASRATATSGELADYRLVHFATHGLFNGDEPALSGLVLSLVDHDGRAQDGFLRLTDIYNLRLSADVVVLSACQTALGKEVRGEGLMGLTRGFMYAGARRVVASLWQVDDLATGELMRRFYTAMLKDGLAPAAALRMAQRDLAREPRWASPFFWSGFQLQGEWR